MSNYPNHSRRPRMARRGFTYYAIGRGAGTRAA